jgi:hypothetical protein
MAGRDDGMELLGELICRLNPYTKRTDPENDTCSGEMDVLVARPSGDSPFSRIQLEIDNKYSADWSFKGTAHHVNTAVRIKYRYPVNGKDGTPLYWIEDYLLLGYEGAGGN